ncbi:PREDICTED: predicted GPI-anchored protein 58, partial [Chinchilla lanigera]|uniref:predicted GPI-anchored protein 58 n=1 Tax=Chinchilla lanigera TaxID=34839 RepID=UPI000698FC77
EGAARSPPSPARPAARPSPPGSGRRASAAAPWNPHSRSPRAPVGVRAQRAHARARCSRADGRPWATSLPQDAARPAGSLRREKECAPGPAPSRSDALGAPVRSEGASPCGRSEASRGPALAQAPTELAAPWLRASWKRVSQRPARTPAAGSSEVPLVQWTPRTQEEQKRSSPSRLPTRPHKPVGTPPNCCPAPTLLSLCLRGGPERDSACQGWGRGDHHDSETLMTAKEPLLEEMLMYRPTLSTPSVLPV